MKIQNRLSASILHFTISLFIFSLFVIILLSYWYPSPFFTASGGWQGLKIVAAVDLVLGPALTLIVFNIKKSRLELFTDLSLIATVQIAALAWGVTTIYSQRPIAAIFWENGFYTVPASALEKQGVNLASLNKYGTEKPLYIFAEQPKTVEDKEALIETIIKDHIPPYHQAERYRPINLHFDEIFKSSVNINEIIEHNKDMKEEIETVLTQSSTQLSENYYIVLNSKYRNIILIFSQTGELLGTASAPLKDEDKV